MNYRTVEVSCHDQSHHDYRCASGQTCCLERKKLHIKKNANLVGGFNPLWKNMGQIGSFPQFLGRNIKNMCNRHHPVMTFMNSNKFYQPERSSNPHDILEEIPMWRFWDHFGKWGKLKAGEASLWEHESNLSKKATLTMTTPPRSFNIDPEKWWLEDYFPIGKVTFQGRNVKLRGCIRAWCFFVWWPAEFPHWLRLVVYSQVLQEFFQCHSAAWRQRGTSWYHPNHHGTISGIQKKPMSDTQKDLPLTTLKTNMTLENHLQTVDPRSC